MRKEMTYITQIADKNYRISGWKENALAADWMWVVNHEYTYW